MDGAEVRGRKISAAGLSSPEISPDRKARGFSIKLMIRGALAGLGWEESITISGGATYKRLPPLGA